MTRPTIGPWFVAGPIASNPEIQINYAPMCTVATITNPAEHMTDIQQDEAEANARLIAAAPELLESLESLFEHCAMVHKHWGEFSNQKEADAAIEAAKAAIKKARGGQ